ncbi:MAG: glycoside hydrolase family 95 protein [Lachnospiraceae bacterium]|nr:glycoside hydrolase family 95 protein [Lachnospiraceae bacterium]
MHGNRELWYDRPAEYWEEALPLGNGRLGAMLDSGIGEECIFLNEDTLWSGYPKDTNLSDPYPHYVRARQLALEKKYKEAQREVEDHLLGEFTDSYLPVGSVRLQFPFREEAAEYTRRLLLSKAQVESSFVCAGTGYRKEAFISVPEQAFYMKLTADRQGKLNFCLHAESRLKSRCTAEGKQLILTGIAPSYDAPSYLEEETPIIYEEKEDRRGMRFCMIVSVEIRAGRISAEDETLRIQDADEAVIRICIRTSFNGYDRQPYVDGLEETGLCRADMEHALSVDYEEARARHRQEYCPLFKSMELSLEAESFPELPTDRRILAFYPEGRDVGLYELFFHYGRYLLISCSRPGTQPANLQGIWNARVRPPWSSNYTVNINTQMNYWGAEICGLGAMHEPLFELIRELSVTGARTARNYYNAGGFVSHHNVDIWRLSTPVGRKGRGAAVYAFWPMSAGWLCRHLYEHYEYSLDKAFLEETAYPLIRGAAVFYRDVLVEDEEGYLIFAPSTSPENVYQQEGLHWAVTASTAMTMSIIREVFEECIRAAVILGKEDALTEELTDKLPHLKPLQIGRDGRILEWNEELDEVEIQHRHISHMYALYPGDQIDRARTPELEKAVRRSLEGRGDVGTGWSLSWKVNAWVRLRDGEHAIRLLKEQLRYVLPDGKEGNSDFFNYHDGGGVYPNLFDAHPPFQIDGNLGSLSGIAEMFLFSSPEEICLLPALPGAFGTGCVRGIHARGRVTADLEFRDGELVRAVLLTDTDQERTLIYGNQREKIHLEAGVPYEVKGRIS